MKVLIIGAAGYIGRSLIEVLPSDTDLHCLDITSQPESISFNGKMEWISGSYIDLDNLSKIPRNIDVAVFLATTMFPSEAEENILNNIDENIFGSVAFIDFLYRDRNCKKIIYASSAGAMYCKEKNIQDECTSYPMSSYGVSKLAVEGYLRLLAKRYNKSSISLRFSNPFGSNPKEGKVYGVIPSFIDSVLSGKKIQLYGEDIKKDFIPISNVLSSILECFEYSGQVTEFNVSSGSLVTLEEVIKKIENKLNKIAEVEYIEKKYPEMSQGKINSDRLKEETNWVCDFDLDDEISKILNCINS